MDRLLYVAMSGAQQAMLAQTANSNNLANLDTPGFRADIVAARSRPVPGPGLASRTYGLIQGPGVDLRSGPLNATGRDLDVAVNGEGFIAVQAPDGGEAYTRAGDLRVSPGGLLTTGAGHLVLGNGGPIAIPPAESLLIGSDGTISIRPLGEAPTNVIEVDRIKLVNPEPATLGKGGDGLLRMAGGGLAPPDAAVTLATGVREGSNVNAVTALVDMIELARAYEMHVKMMRVADENDAADAQLLRLGA